MRISNDNPESVALVFPVGASVLCELEWLPGKWRRGTVACHQLNGWGVPQWIIIELEDGGDAEYDYRYLDVEDQRNSLVRLVK